MNYGHLELKHRGTADKKKVSVRIRFVRNLDIPRSNFQSILQK